MYNSKRDVDRHVQELRTKVKAEDEFAGKCGYNIAKLYYNVGEYQLATKYLDKFDQVRRNSSLSYKLRGQALEQLANISDDGRGNDQSNTKRLKTEAIEAYKITLDLDASQKDLILKVIELMLDLPIGDPERTRYWVEQGNKFFPRNKSVSRLRVKMEDTKNLIDAGTGASSVVTSASSVDDEGSPKEGNGNGYGNEDDDNSILWSAATGGGSSFLNGSRQYDTVRNSTGKQTSYHSTPIGFQRNGNTNGTSSRDAVRRFPPRPSPERLQAQVKSVEAMQEKMRIAMEDQSRAMQETMEALLSETRQAREEAAKERNRGNSGAFSANSTDASVAIHLKGIHDTVIIIQKEMDAMRKDLIAASQKRDNSSVDGGSVSKPCNGSHTRHPLELADLQDALTQQAALIQMSQYGLIGPLLAANAAVRQPAPSIHPSGIITHPQQINPLLHMQGSNQPFPGIDQSRLPGSVGTAPLNPWPASTPAPQQPLPQMAPGVIPSSMNNPHVNLPQTPVTISRSSVGPVVNTNTTPNIPLNLRQDNFAVHPNPTLNGPISTQSPSSFSPANVVITTSDKIPTEEEVKAAAATSNTPIINSVTVPPQHRLGGITAPSNLATPSRNTHLAALEAVSPATPDTLYSTPPTQVNAGRTHNVSGGGTPHDYHIKLPSGVSPLTTSPFGEQDGPAVAITTTSIWSHIPAPLHSSLSTLSGGGGVTNSNTSPEKSTGFNFSFGASGGRQRQASVSSVKSDGSQVEGAEHDARPDFEAIIPLPDIVEVKTGEEDEEVLFEDRCKLYCWRDGFEKKEWKERGIGQIKILQSKADNAKIRVLMRRDQVLKICANHFLNPNVSIDFMKNSANKAATWVANDYSEETAQVETFSARFKTPEQTEAFIQAFKDAQQKTLTSTGNTTEVKKEIIPPTFPTVPLGNAGVEIIKKELPTTGFGDKFKVKVGSWECPGCMCRNSADTMECPSCETAQPGHEEEVKAKKEASKAKEEAEKPKFNFLPPGGGFKMPTAGSGASTGFTFGTQSNTSSNSTQGGFVFGQTSDKKEKEEKPSPFAGFSFLGSAANADKSGSGVEVVSAVSSQEASQDLNISEELSFDGQGLKLNTEQDAKLVADKITTYPKGKLKILTLSGNTIGIDAAKEIGRALESRPELERAHWNDMFTGKMKTEIPPALKHMCGGVMKAGAQLVELDFSDNAFGPIGAEAIVDFLKSPSCRTLKELKLNNTGCGVTGGKMLAKALLEAYHESVKVNPNNPLGLRVFILGRSRQENEGGKALAEVFKHMGTLEEVVMPQNGIFHEGIEALADAFGNNPNLRILNINDNTLTEKGAKHLASALKKLKHLEKLNIGDCLIKTGGAKLIAAALKESGAVKLQELYIDSNEIRLEGGLAVVDALKSSINLTKLMLDGNQFGDEGCNQIEQNLNELGKKDIMDEFEDDQGSDEDSDEEEDDSNDEGDDDDNEDDSEGDMYEKENNPSTFTNISSGLFGSKQGTPSIFGGANTADTSSPSIFGETKPCSIFGTPTQDNKSVSSIFGGSSTLGGTNSQSSTSIFGTPKTNGNSSSLFGDDKKSTSSTTPIFGTPAPIQSGGSSIFSQAVSGSVSGAAGSIFGKSTTEIENKGFGGATPGTTSIFGQAVVNSVSASAGSLFGGSTPIIRSDKENEGTDLSANKALASFSSLSSGDTPLFGQKKEGFSFAGTGASVFGSGNKVPNGNRNEENDDSHVEENEHDPHFEPIIPLPELVDVKTGEEEEEEIFKHRAKVYRYDTETKQWKERGVGDIKILKHPQKLTYRVILRRDQTLKVACNHVINEGMELKPMSTSETALCWYAIDYAEGEGKTEQLAVKFKLSDTKNDFKAAFEAAQAALKTKKETPTKEERVNTPKIESVTPKPEDESLNENKGLDLSASKNLFSFASLGTTDKPLFGQKTEGFSFAGTNKPLFGSPSTTKNETNNDDNKEDQVEDNDHDPHFEPIIPLPELVDVKTGEEEEEEVFKHRAKVYRYDTDTKQWKERGVGDMKILKHPQKGTYRVLLRRDQTLKVACNHMIAEAMVLKPMATSETALCWYAIDYAEGEGRTEQLAVKFKFAETKNDFKDAFEAAQNELRNKEKSNTDETKFADDNDSSKPHEKSDGEPQREEDEYEDEEDDDDDEDSDSTMFERQCVLLEKEGNVENSLGQVDLRILYDDDVFGARIAAYSGNETSGIEVCNHLIAMQTTLDVSTPSEGTETYRCSWSALDFSVDPPKYRSFVAVFDNSETFQEFKDTFYEGKELAEQSEILENPEGTVGQDH